MPKNTQAVVRRGRPTTHINRRVTQSMFRAFDFADAIGQPLNVYVVINLRETAAASAATQFERVRHKFRDWLCRRAKQAGMTLPPAYVYAHENPSGRAHVNWALHVPDALRPEFEKKLERWINRVLGGCNRFTYSCKTIARRAKTLAKYIAKGTDPAFVDHFHLADFHVPQGLVWGKRAGVSAAIGPSARKRVNYRPRRGKRTYSPR